MEMNRERRIAVWVAVLIGMLVAWKLFGQGFGSFVRDQPYLAANPATATGEADWPEQALLMSYFDTRSATNVQLSGTLITNWVNKATAADPALADVSYAPVWASSGGASNYGYAQFFATNYNEWSPTNNNIWSTNTLTMAVVYACVAGTHYTMGMWGTAADAGTSGLGTFEEFAFSPNGLTTGTGNRPLASKVTIPSFYPPAGWHSLVAVFQGTTNNPSTNIMVWTNGTFFGQGPQVDDIVKAPWRMGRWQAIGTWFTGGRIHRFMLWNGALSSNDAQTVSTRLSSEFGL